MAGGVTLNVGAWGGAGEIEGALTYLFSQVAATLPAHILLQTPSIQAAAAVQAP